MPRSGIIGVFLQLFAGLIFLIYRFRQRTLESNLMGELTKAFDSPTFHSRLPLLAIPFIVPLFLVVYFRLSSTDIPWSVALLSDVHATKGTSVPSSQVIQNLVVGLLLHSEPNPLSTVAEANFRLRLNA